MQFSVSNAVTFRLHNALPQSTLQFAWTIAISLHINNFTSELLTFGTDSRLIHGSMVLCREQHMELTAPSRIIFGGG